MASGNSAPKKGYFMKDRLRSGYGLGYYSKQGDKKKERKEDCRSKINFDSIALALEQNDLIPATTMTTGTKSLFKSSAKYVSSLRKEDTLIDIMTLKKQDSTSLKKKGNVFPIPLELDVRCKQNCVPVVYDSNYDIHTTRPQFPLPAQLMLMDKSAQVFSKIKGKQYQGMTSMDISSFYNISNYVCSTVRQVDVVAILDLMKLQCVKICGKPDLVVKKDFSSVVLRPLRYQVMGSVLACRLALEKGWAINIGGGFSHHSSNTGGGLSIYDDVLMCLAIMSNLQEVDHIMLINMDAYQSSCYKREQNINCKVTVIDVYSEPLPETNDWSDTTGYIQYHDYKISSGFDIPTSYMYSTIRDITKLFFDDDFIKPSLCIYVAGTNVLEENPHTKMQFTLKHLLRRDAEVFKLMQSQRVPIAFLMGGGYQPYDVEASSASIRQILTEYCSDCTTGKTSRIHK